LDGASFLVLLLLVVSHLPGSAPIDGVGAGDTD
jgi:hypothetical protein